MPRSLLAGKKERGKKLSATPPSSGEQKRKPGKEIGKSKKHHKLNPGVPPKSPEHSRRRKPGKLAAMEVRKLQKTSHQLVQRSTFQKLVRDSHPFVNRFSPSALRLLQDSAEAYLISIFQDAQQCSMHAGRKTVMKNDIALVGKLRDGFIGKH